MALLASLVVGCLFGGCYDPKQVKAFLAEPRAQVALAEYRVLPPDTLQTLSTKVPEINAITQQIRPDGKINLPVVGDISVAGLTPKEIEAAVNKAAGKLYEEAECTVLVVGYNSQHYYVFGQVASPGPVPWTGRDSVLDALAKTQPTNLAWIKRIIITRGDQPQIGGHAGPVSDLRYRLKGVRKETKDRPRKKLLFNLDAMIKSGDMSNNILLQPGDVIYVQPSPLAKVGLMIQNLLLPIRPAAEAVSAPARAASMVTGTGTGGGGG